MTSVVVAGGRVLKVEASIVDVDVLMSQLVSSKLPLTRDEFKEMLEGFHKAGFIAYFGAHPKLRKYVVTKPHRVIDAISTLITTE